MRDFSKIQNAAAEAPKIMMTLLDTITLPFRYS